MYLRVNLLGPGPRFVKKSIYRSAVSQRLRNTGIEHYHYINLLREGNFNRFLSVNVVRKGLWHVVLVADGLDFEHSNGNA